ncbi:MAG: hypothetical protein QF632_02235 [Candidatus Woesearchaeota archaeon]|jgi:antitoxin component of MazEF toxin-antitoxin module|nr:hypothetical protein [Candidatus Woesearchaeota archaeon]MDP7457684.1 hypothetical protein [Candidatus Woesearchaeota archaeon]|tara:strand:+ start:186 stop:407 length:222 start_codon:yes stop_codon:yes gene_type:complete
MIELETNVKQWGNSIGIVIPKGKAKQAHIKPNDKVRIMITRKKDSLKVKDIFGTVKLKQNTQDLMKEIDKEFE